MAKISVVLTTYNGVDYLLPQLESLRQQTDPPEQVYISDDASTDGTAAFIEDYIRRHRLVSWQLHVNLCNRGKKHHFWQALHLAEHDLILPCDQDDVWRPEKVALIRGAFAQQANMQLLTSAFKPFRHFPDKPVAPAQAGTPRLCDFTTYFLKRQQPGCSYGLTRELLQCADMFWQPDQPHAFTLWQTALLLQSAYFYPEVLLDWRVQANSAHYQSNARVPEMLRHPKRTYWRLRAKKAADLAFQLGYLDSVAQSALGDVYARQIWAFQEEFRRQQRNLQQCPGRKWPEIIRECLTASDQRQMVSQLYFGLAGKLFSGK